MSMNENGKRQDIFLTLVDRGDVCTPTEIGNEIGETRQTVKYHVDRLVDNGLVVKHDDGYRAQPVFTDDDFEERFVDLLAELVPEVGRRIEVDDDAPPDTHTAAVFNCIRMFVALELLEPREADTNQTRD